MASTSNPNYITPNKTIEETIEIIKNKISTKTPFALTRFGDGEIYILNRSGGDNFEEKNCKLWGYKYPQEVNQFYDDAGKIVKNAFVGNCPQKCRYWLLSVKPSPFGASTALGRLKRATERSRGPVPSRSREPVHS